MRHPGRKWLAEACLEVWGCREVRGQRPAGPRWPDPAMRGVLEALVGGDWAPGLVAGY